MLTNFSSFPKMISIEDEIDDLYSNIMDTIHPNFTTMSNMITPYFHGKRRLYDNSKYIISLVVGANYHLKDIQTTVQGRKLKVTGKSSENFKNGSNSSQFERVYEIPDNVNINTMKTDLDKSGTLKIIFDKNQAETKNEVQDLSTKDEFVMKYNFQQSKPAEMSVKIHGRNLTVEASSKSHSTNEDGSTKYSSSSYMSRTMHLDDDVDVEKLRAWHTPDGSLEIHAPRSGAKLKGTERNIKIEESGKRAKIGSK